MQDSLMVLGALFLALLIIDGLIEYRSYRRRKANGEQGKFLKWI